MDDLDDVIGLLNSNRPNQKAKAQFMPAPDTFLPGQSAPTQKSAATTEEQKEIADRKLNIEKMMEELEAMKKKK